ncbi:hypothetical protein pdul_cds_816 [Pandoravirus dulcis]|uniref:Uncharacterized protein n=1 Tax=Pandoravirus dulcis TaxID=1349409 RepID=S4VRN5_9VIRU|nr:hypothetical protein pdul_cds_816 [Pandoravirus dulcis]AGO83023.1 hypothetical protein pdul_cds_816 [Pandoravirus dulcis]
MSRQGDIYEFVDLVDEYVTPRLGSRAAFSPLGESPAQQWLEEFEDNGLLLTGDKLASLDSKTAHLVVPIDAIVAHKGPIGATPNDHALELVVLETPYAPVTERSAVNERLTDQAGLGPDDRLYAGVVLYDRWTNDNTVTPWAALGSPDTYVRGVYDGVPTRYALLP